MTEQEERKFLTPPEAAALFRTSEEVLAHWRCNNTGPKFLKLGAKVLYALADLEAWARDNTFNSTSEVDAVRSAVAGGRSNG